MIGGTSVGGIIALGLQHKPDGGLEEMAALLEDAAASMFDCGGFTRNWRRAWGEPLCDTARFERLLQGYFGTAAHSCPSMPIVFATTCVTETGREPDQLELRLLGNFRRRKYEGLQS